MSKRLGIGASIAAVCAIVAVGAGDATPSAAGTPSGCRVETRGVVEHSPRAGHRIALTFDEYLGADSRPILNALDDAGARATFFTVGEQLEGNEALARRMVRDGHELGNHAYTHPDLTEMGTRRRREELRRTQQRVERVTGFEPCLMRPPYGQFDDAVVADARRLGLGTVTWDLAGGDYLGWSPDEIANQVLANVRPGSIVLLHQLSNSAAALPRILDGLDERGLRSTPVVKLLGGRFTGGR